jgi:hypothetical protein
MKLHLVWLGSAPTENVLRSKNNWNKQVNLDVEIATEFRFPETFVPSSIPKSAPWAQFADIVRLTPFEESSGWYADIDCEPGQSPLTNPVKSVFFRTNSRVLGNGFFYMQHNPALYTIWLNEIKSGLRNPNITVGEATGPGALTRSVYLYAFDYGAEKSRQDLALGSWKQFRHWPSHLVPGATGKRLLPFTNGKLATHFADGSWVKVKHSRVSAPKRLLRQMVWQIRNSILSIFSETVRAILRRKINPNDLFNPYIRAALRSAQIIFLDTWKGSRTDPIQAQEAHKLEAVRQLVANLDCLLISTSNTEAQALLKRSNWAKIDAVQQSSVFARPPLKMIMDGYSSRHMLPGG